MTARPPGSAYLKDLPVLQALAEELHFGRAAQRLTMTQPQLSQIIRRIEHRVGFPIFVRRPRVRMTPAGELLVGATARVLDDLGSAVERAQQLAAGQIGTVRLGYAPVAMLTNVPATIRRFLSENPGATIKLTEAHSGNLLPQLENGGFDVIISRERPAGEHVCSLEIARDTLVAALPSNHPLAGEQELDLAILQPFDFVMFGEEASPGYHRAITRLCREAGFDLRVVQQANVWSTILALVANDFGISLVSGTLARIPFPGVAFVPITGRPCVATFWVSWMAGRETPVSTRLRAALHSDTQYEPTGGHGQSLVETSRPRERPQGVESGRSR